jgi:hypothetical protein
MRLVLPRASFFLVLFRLVFKGHYQLSATVKMPVPESYLFYAAWLQAIVNIYIPADSIAVL